jgi:type I restriction enzyme R subunit
VLLLEDERLRAEFDVALKLFLATFDTVLPRPQALPFAEDAALFGEIQVLARRRYRDTVDGDFDPYKYKEKVRRLIDDHVTVLDLTQKVRPVRITDPEFAAHVNALASDRTRASEMEHALRHHIREHVDEDPVYYGRLSERIDEILDRLEDRWEQIALELEDAVRDLNTGRTDEGGTGLNPETELPFHNLMAERLASSDPDAATKLVDTTRSLVEDIRRQISMVGFWENATKQDELRRSVKRNLDRSDLFDYSDLDALAVNLVDLAKANQHRLR